MALLCICALAFEKYDRKDTAAGATPDISPGATIHYSVTQQVTHLGASVS